MELKIKIRVNFGNDAMQTLEDAKTEILADLEGLFNDVAFLDINDEIETGKKILDLNGQSVGAIHFETVNKDKGDK